MRECLRSFVVNVWCMNVCVCDVVYLCAVNLSAERIVALTLVLASRPVFAVKMGKMPVWFHRMLATQNISLRWVFFFRNYYFALSQRSIHNFTQWLARSALRAHEQRVSECVLCAMGLHVFVCYSSARWLAAGKRETRPSSTLTHNTTRLCVLLSRIQLLNGHRSSHIACIENAHTFIDTFSIWEQRHTGTQHTHRYKHTVTLKQDQCSYIINAAATRTHIILLVRMCYF